MVVLPAETAEGTWWSNSISSSFGRQRRAAAAAKAAEKGIIVTKDGHSTTRSRRYDFAAVEAGKGAVVTEDGSSTHEAPPHRKAAAVEVEEGVAEEGVVVTEDGSSTHEVPPHRVTHKYGKKTTQPPVAVLSSGRETLPYCAPYRDATVVHSIDWEARTCHKGDEENEGKCPGYPTNIKRGICETTGTPLPYLSHQEVMPGKIYYGLDFNDHSYEGHTYTPHQPPDHNGSCYWGHGKKVGECKRNGVINGCPSTQRKIVQAWQECAKLCNDEPECHTFTVRTQAYLNTRSFNCYFHKSYECQSAPSSGIANYEVHGDIQHAKYDDLGVWGGICRIIHATTKTNGYACSEIPIPCAGDYGSNDPCCKQGGTSVEPQFQCPQSKPTCVNYVYNNHYGTCRV